MKFKGLLLMGLSAGIVGMTQTDVAHANVPWLNITDKSVPRTDFVDISSHNGVPTVQEFKIMKNYGVKGVMVKLTEATSYRNPYAASQIANAKAAGLTVGGYHYSWYTDEATARAEGRYFAQFAKELGLPTNTPMADDLEEPQVKYANLNGKVNTHTKAFRAGVAGAGYTNNILYTYGSYATESGLSTASFGKKNVWMASYPFTPSKDSLWHTDVGMWQFNSNMHFPNVRGTFDANIDYAGTMSGGSSASKPKPKPKPKPTVYKSYFKFDQSRRNDWMFTTAPYGYEGAKGAGRVPDGQIVWIEKREKAANGVTWYYAKINGKYVWFDALSGSLLRESDVKQTSVNKTYEFDQNGRKDSLYTTAPYGFAGSKDVGKAKQGVSVKVDKQMVNDGVTWFYGTVNGQKVWFDAKAVKLPSTALATTKVSKYFVTNQSSRRDGMFENAPFRYAGSKSAGWIPNNRLVWVEKQHKSETGSIWYYGEINGRKVWFDSLSGSVLKVQDVTQTTVNKTYVFNQNGRKDSLYTTAPYGFAGSKDVGKPKHDASVKVEKQIVNNGVTWFYGTVNGQKVWFDSKAVNLPVAPLTTTKVSKYFVTNQSTRRDGMFENAPFRYAGSKSAGWIPNNRLVWVEKQHKSNTGVVWYYGQINGRKVWFDSLSGSVLKVQDVKQTAVNKNYVFNQTGRKDSLYTTAPYGFASSKDVGKAKHGVTVKVDKQMVNNGVTWFYGTVNGQKVWFDANAVKIAPVAKKAMVEASSETPASVKKETSSKVMSSSSSATSSEQQKRTSSESQVKETSGKMSEESSAVVQNVKFDFIFDQTKREDDLYKEVKGMPVDTKVLRPAVDKEILHVTKQFVDEDGTIWYGAKLNKDFVWFETKAGRVNI
ncbi:GH25 family lysozyme [Weissella tructae]|uniref:ToxA_2 protein n=2 Tax=Weissella TaxID=46255 RepID=A0A075U6E6_9LACO|nr:MULTISPECIES: GH25 family lysozyme [Weissella]AIG65712.1 ToxA_2 protein [Weissella tructae]AIM63028.1 ToxA_2 protein [Weissella ceti]AIM64427.1 ToxA_2 protein [Weissella ceti]ELA06835.1 1,4-beta-N-acetylmuramidase [Weissella ceti NC36]QVV90878.1 SH3-like domain-containing protein [Weissella tructae]